MPVDSAITAVDGDCLVLASNTLRPEILCLGIKLFVLTFRNGQTDRPCYGILESSSTVDAGF